MRIMMAAIGAILLLGCNEKPKDVREAIAEIEADHAAHMKEISEKTDRLRSNPDSANSACTAAIKRSLHDPYSSEIEYIYNGPNSDGSFTALYRVRAKNAFNAYRLADYQCHLSVAEGEWSVLSIVQK